VARSPALAAVGLSVALGAACGSDPVGVDDCRKIENARCDAASHCGDRLKVTDVDECQRFYRNQCLHGLATAKNPGPGQVAACVRIIQTAGSCAAQNSPTTALAACGDATLASETDPALVDVCKVVESPELTAECSFLSGAATGGSGAGGGGAGGAESGGSGEGGSSGAAGTGGA
jgi:hypothetical protein